MKTISIEVLLSAGVLITLVSVLGMLRMQDPYQRMHYIAPPASLSAILIAAAVFIQQGLKPESFKAIFAACVLTGMNAVVTHAAARAFRIAEVKDWDPREGEEVPIKAGDEIVSGEKSS
ncbi:MAG: cation:proton antiporter [Terriglobales bacterium]